MNNWIHQIFSSIINPSIPNKLSSTGLLLRAHINRCSNRGSERALYNAHISVSLPPEALLTSAWFNNEITWFLLNLGDVHQVRTSLHYNSNSLEDTLSDRASAIRIHWFKTFKAEDIKTCDVKTWDYGRPHLTFWRGESLWFVESHIFRSDIFKRTHRCDWFHLTRSLDCFCL